ncbi:hypothetical protein DL96DRAFT_1467994 [Flagelloscypha sp. PMI_526]|nr:hypothetical protein DL96DRAFT_1467994 [Flagelloscypha sp. PMI_526]
MSNYVFIKTGRTVSGSSHGSSRTRTSSYSSVQHPPMPSPLRYSTRESSSAHGHGSTSSRSSRRSSHERPPLPRSSSYKPERDHSSPYSIYAPRAVAYSSSSRTDSSNSVTRPGSAASGGLPRNPSTGSVSSQGSCNPRRPALKTNNSWTGKPHNPNAHVTFMNPSRTTALHMHPVLAYTKQSQAPISYDVTYPPSSHTVVDRNTRASVPKHTLQESATDPITVSTLVLTSDKLPWPVVVRSRRGSSSSSKSSAKFYIGERTTPSDPTSSSTYVTNNDVLRSLHDNLYTRVTQEEWDALGSGSLKQKRVWKTYEARCQNAGGGHPAGVRRIDYLGEKTRLVGIEVDRSSEGGRLVFARP